MAVASPVSDRLTVAALLLLTFATGIVDAISVLVLGHVFVANMTGNVIFLGFWFVPGSGVDLTAAVVAFRGFVAGTILRGRLARHLGRQTRLWLASALGMEIVVFDGHREKLRYSVVFTMCGGAVLGATLSRVTVAPVIALAALVVLLSLLIFRFGPTKTADLPVALEGEGARRGACLGRGSAGSPEGFRPYGGREEPWQREKPDSATSPSTSSLCSTTR